MYNFQIPELNFMSQKESDFSVRFARFINERNVVEIMEAVEEARRDVGQNVNPKMIFFDFGLRMIVLIIR
jgi:DNA polymerase-3 subunit delta'